MAEKNTDRWYDLLLGQMEKLNGSYNNLSEKLLEINTEIGKLFSMKGTISDLKAWHDEINKNVTADDLANIKKFYTNFSGLKEELEEIHKIQKEINDTLEDYKKFKTKMMTIISIIVFLFGTALTILSWFIK